jgi:hypothetical protein
MANNLFGVDVNPHAIRVASFSLYLAMCDAIDPRRYWNDVKLPRLRDRSLITADFFSEDIPGISTDRDTFTYDLIIGNAPWGRNTEKSEEARRISEEARRWSVRYGWHIVDKNTGTLFLAKGATLVKRDGYVAMLQSASSLLFNRSPTAIAFRRKFFSEYKTVDIVNFSALRFGLFAKSVSPTVSIIFLPIPPDGEPISYTCLKSVERNNDSFRITIEPHDTSEVYPQDALDATIWSIKMWGGNRDKELITQN